MTPAASFQISAPAAFALLRHCPDGLPRAVFAGSSNFCIGCGGALPAGITSNPPSPFTVAAGASTSVLFGAARQRRHGKFHSFRSGNQRLSFARRKPCVNRTKRNRASTASHYLCEERFDCRGGWAGDRVFVAFGLAPAGPLAVWNATAPNQFATSNSNSSSTDLGAAADGTMFSVQANGATEIRGSDLALSAVPAARELTQIPRRVAVPGLTLHPSGALVYQPFPTSDPGSVGVKGGIDILDGHSGALRLRIFLPQQFLTDVEGLHGSFLTADENGQRLFAITSSDGTPQNASLTVVQLANVPLGIGTVSPSTVSAAGGGTLSIRGSDFQNGITCMINGKTASATFKDSNTLSILVPALSPGAQQLTLTNPDGETVSLDAAFTAN